MNVFVNYDGPKLDKKQKKAVRSQVMVVVRGLQKTQAKLKYAADVTSLKPSPRPLAPARDENHTSGPEDEIAKHSRPEQRQHHALVARQSANSSRKRDRMIADVSQQQKQQQQQQQQEQPRQPVAGRLNPYDLRGAPPQSTHMTGVDARTFQNYLCRCGSYSSYLDEGFVLVGFQQPSYFRPDLSKAACIYIGWLLTAGVLDAFRGTHDIAYPYYEYQAVKELQRYIDGAGARELHEVVYPVLILGMFEMVRFSPRAVTHLAAVERFIKSRGGLHSMPDVMQHLVIMTDMLQCICLDTPLAFNDLGAAPAMHLLTAGGVFFTGNQLFSSPLLLCDGEDLSLAAQYAHPVVRVQLVAVLQAASDSFQQFFGPEPGVGHAAQSPSDKRGLAADLMLDEMLSGSTAANDVKGLFLDTCALAARIMRRTLSGGRGGFEDAENELDVLMVYLNVRFLGLKAWTGLPYVYIWVNLVGFAASTDARMRSYFMAEVVRCAFSYGCYQMEVFRGVLRNFLHLRIALADRKMALYAAGQELVLA